MICSICLGRRKLLGFGAMMKECVACSGTGSYSPIDEVKIKLNGARRDHKYKRRTKEQIALDKLKEA